MRVKQAIAALAGDADSAPPALTGARLAGLHRSTPPTETRTSGVLPQFEIIVLSGGRRIIEFDHLNADDNRYITEMIEGTIIQIGSHNGDRFTVDATGYNLHIPPGSTASPAPSKTRRIRP